MIELSLVLKATVLLALGLAAAALARNARASVRHLWLAATFGALGVLPILAAAAPPVTVVVPAEYSAIARAASIPPASTAATDTLSRGTSDPGAAPSAARGGWTLPSWMSMARTVWSAGAAALLGSLVVSLARVRRIRRDGLPRTDLAGAVATLASAAGVRRSIDVLEHEAVPAPLTCGLWRPAIVLPRDARGWSDADVKRALMHEIEHIARGDWGTHLAARVVCAAYWFHPLAWTALRGLCLEAERACDDAVLRSEDRADYADQLVLLARRFTGVHARAMVGMASRSDLSARVTAVLDDRLRRGHASARTAAAAFVAAGLAVALLAPVRAGAAAPSITEPPPQSALRADVDQRMRTARARAVDRALLEAAEDGDIPEIERLLAAGADVNAAVEGDGSPLIAAARANRLAVARLLLDRGANPNLAVPGDGSPLIAAASDGAVNMMTLLLARGANIELAVEGDENPLIQASAAGRLDAVKLLVAHGANVNAQAWADLSGAGRQGEYRTPLSMARRGRHADVVAFLIASGARD